MVSIINITTTIASNNNNNNNNNTKYNALTDVDIGFINILGIVGLALLFLLVVMGYNYVCFRKRKEYTKIKHNEEEIGDIDNIMF